MYTVLYVLNVELGQHTPTFVAIITYEGLNLSMEKKWVYLKKNRRWVNRTCYSIVTKESKGGKQVNKSNLRTADLKNPQSFLPSTTKALIQKYYLDQLATVPRVLALLLFRG